MKIVKITLDSTHSITLEYRPGFRFHADLENANLVPYGKFLALGPDISGHVVGIWYNGAGELSYTIQRVRKDGRPWKGRYFDIAADDMPPSYKRVISTIEVKEFAQ